MSVCWRCYLRGVLRELKVQNLLLIEEATLEFSEGLNVLTGETGAGKTLLATALGLLLGDRSRSGLVRPDAAEAWVEGIFDLDESIPAEVLDRLPGDAEEIVLARRIWPDGRSRALVNGRTATVGELRDLAAHLLSFYGQHEHRKLALNSFQRETLDAACGGNQNELLSQAASNHAQTLELEKHLENLTGSQDGGERERDLLEFELEEISRVAPVVGELASLDEEITRLQSAATLINASSSAADAISPADDNPGATGLIGSSERALQATAGVDQELDGLVERLVNLRIELEELAREFRSHAESIDQSPGRLEELIGRRDEISALERKHGGSTAAVLEHAEHCRVRIGELSDLGGAIANTQQELESLRTAQASVCKRIHDSRVKRAKGLSIEVEEALAQLALDGARFSIQVEDGGEQTAHGSDRVEFTIQANKGIAGGPLGDIASGGEMSRILLALLTVAHKTGNDRGRQMIVFDEIDAGIGGRTSKVVGERLRDLGERSQVLCITHLPQVAVLAERHFVISKTSDAQQTVTYVRRLESDQIVDEMVRMLGGHADDSAARAHALELLEAA